MPDISNMSSEIDAVVSSKNDGGLQVDKYDVLKKSRFFLNSLPDFDVRIYSVFD